MIVHYTPKGGAKVKRTKIANAQEQEEHPYLETTEGANQFKYFGRQLIST